MSSQETTKVTLTTLKLALEPLFFFTLEFLQNDRLSNLLILWCLLWNHNSSTENTLALALTFLQGTLLSELETIIGPSTVSDLSFETTLAADLDPSHRETGWMMTEEELSDRC